MRPAALCVAALVVLAASCGGSDDDADATSTTAADRTEQPDGSAQGSGVPSGDCANVHAGHSAMMWNPTMADEMLDADCGWPYEPFLVDLDGGEDDPALTAPFEATRYSELWTAISSSGIGVCSVGTELEGDGVGRAFGFTYRVAPPGCPDAKPTGAVHVAEFGTEAQRDLAAHDAAADGTETYVLGRWVISLDGDTGTLDTALDELGAQPVT